jgi:hypothetical protein
MVKELRGIPNMLMFTKRASVRMLENICDRQEEMGHVRRVGPWCAFSPRFEGMKQSKMNRRAQGPRHVRMCELAFLSDLCLRGAGRGLKDGSEVVFLRNWLSTTAISKRSKRKIRCGVARPSLRHQHPHSLRGTEILILSGVSTVVFWKVPECMPSFPPNRVFPYG